MSMVQPITTWWLSSGSGAIVSRAANPKSHSWDTKAFKGKGGPAALLEWHRQVLSEIEAEMRQLASSTQELEAPCCLHLTHEQGRPPRLRWRLAARARYYTFADCSTALTGLAPIVVQFFRDCAGRAQDLNLVARIQHGATQSLEQHLHRGTPGGHRPT